VRVLNLIKIKLLTKVYGKKQETFSLFQNKIEKAIADLDAKIKGISFDDKGFASIELEGEDEVVAANYLSSLYGKGQDLGKIKVGDTVKGYICSSGKVGFGVFVDIGIKEPYIVDALLPLFALRNQLVEGNKIPVRTILELFSLVDFFPIEITIEKVSIGLKNIEAKLSEEQVERFAKWREEGLEKLLIIGAFEEDIRNVLERTKHDKDIVAFETLGWMEHIITCKFNTTAKGLIPIIGRLIPKAKFEIFSPANIRRAIKKVQKS